MGACCHSPNWCPDSSVVRVLARLGIGPVFESWSGSGLFPAHVTFGGSLWVLTLAVSSKWSLSSVIAWSRADLGTKCILQG